MNARIFRLGAFFVVVTSVLGSVVGTTVEKAPIEEWNKTFYRGVSAQQTSDGGYIIVCSTLPKYHEIWLMKTNSNCDEEWTSKTFYVKHTFLSIVRQTSDRGYIIVCAPGDDAVGLVKMDPNGTEEWFKRFRAKDYHQDECRSVQQTSDGGYILAGARTFGSDPFEVQLIKTDANGTKEWIKTFGGSSGESGESVQQTSDGGYIITGNTLSYGAGKRDVWLIKTDANGTEEWNKTFGGADSDRGNSVQQASDGGYIVVGSTYSYGAGKQDVWLIKTDANGTEEWNKTFGGAEYDRGNSVQQASDGGYIVVGNTYCYDARKCGVLLIKVREEEVMEEASTPIFTQIPLPTHTSTPEVPAFDVMFFSIAGLLVVTYLLRRKE